MPELVRPLNPEETRTFPAIKRTVFLQQPCLAHHSLRPLSVYLTTKFSGTKRSDHPRSISRIFLSYFHDYFVDLIENGFPFLTCWSSLGFAVDRLA
jgi:hypothetical protein